MKPGIDRVVMLNWHFDVKGRGTDPGQQKFGYRFVQIPALCLVEDDSIGLRI